MKKILSTVLLSTLLLAGCGDDEAKSDNEERNFYKAGGATAYVDKIGNVTYKYSGYSIDTVPFKDLTLAQVKILQKEGVKFPEELIKEKEEMQAKK